MPTNATCSACGQPATAHAEGCPRRSDTLRRPDGDPVVTEDLGPRRSSRPPAVPTRANDPLIGMQLGDYVVKAPVGGGGMGLVYEGLEPRIGKRVAIKVLRRDRSANEDVRLRFEAEAKAVNAVRHRGIVDIFAFGELPDGRQYCVMEYLEGVPLDARLAERGRLPPGEVISILDEILAALGAAHAAGVIHRDVKPSNVFLATQPDGSSFVKVVDFGLAKMSPTTGGVPEHVSAAFIVGTPRYMAPEQATGDAITPRTDLYAVGVLAFEMLTGRLPFDDDSNTEVIRLHLSAPPPSPMDFEPSVPRPMADLVLRLMAKNPADRPASAGVVRQELERIRVAFRHPVGTDKPTQPLSSKVAPTVAGPSRLFTRRVAFWAGVCVGAVAVLLAGWLATFIKNVVLESHPPASRSAPTAEPAEAAER